MSSKKKAAKKRYRFDIGTRVECRVDIGWASGTIVALNYREDDWPPGTTVPYQVQLDDRRRIFAPVDDDRMVRQERKCEIHAMLEAQDEDGLRQKCQPLTMPRSKEDQRAQVQLLNEPDRNGEPPIVCMFKRDTNVQWILKAASILAEGGADMGAKDRQESTVLHYAASRGDPDLLDYCLKLLDKADEYHLDINSADMEGSEYTSGQWVVLEEDKRYLSDQEKQALDAQACAVRAQNNTVSATEKQL